MVTNCVELTLYIYFINVGILDRNVLLSPSTPQSHELAIIHNNDENHVDWR